MGKHHAPELTLREKMNTYIAGREPAILAALTGIAVKLIAAFWADLGIEQQSLLNAAVAGGFGLAVATITRDGISAALLGLAQALLALAIGFGLHLGADTQALIMSILALIVGMYERTQVTAPQPPNSA